ncbi:MAG: protein translocase subunit SecF [Patescibacteria group bacterium]
MNIPFLKFTKLYYILSASLAILAVLAISIFGLKMGLDFSGGSILEIQFDNRPSNDVIQEKLQDLGIGEIVIQPTGENGAIIRMGTIDENTHAAILSRLGGISNIGELRFESIGPAVGKELSQKTLVLIIVSLVALLIYIAIAFRKVSWPVSSLQYGLISILALTFDVLITIGVFSLLGKFYNVQFNIPIITALLTILGYTINDKVIVFDRVRENLIKNRMADFKDIVNRSLNQTLFRSISTGFCSLLALLAIFFLGGETLKYFALTLIVGIVIGTYSSLFLASPLLVSWRRRR